MIKFFFEYYYYSATNTILTLALGASPICEIRLRLSSIDVIKCADHCFNIFNSELTSKEV